MNNRAVQRGTVRAILHRNHDTQLMGQNATLGLFAIFGLHHQPYRHAPSQWSLTILNRRSRPRLLLAVKGRLKVNNQPTHPPHNCYRNTQVGVILVRPGTTLHSDDLFLKLKYLGLPLRSTVKCCTTQSHPLTHLRS